MKYLVLGDIHNEYKLFMDAVLYAKENDLTIISVGDKKLVFTADLLPSIGHIPLPYVMGYDTQPLITLKEKKLFLEEAAHNKYVLFLEHDDKYECCTVKMTDRGVRLDQCGKLTDLLY